MREPQIHSHISDRLLGGHPLIYQAIFCDWPGCRQSLHSSNNECMQSWVETGLGNFCLKHFIEAVSDDLAVLDECWGLPDFGC